MATINRARHYFAYVMAVFIAGVFSFFGKSAPSWAQEIKSERSAKVFKELITVAQATNQPAQTVTVDRAFAIPGRPAKTTVGDDRAFAIPGRPVSADQSAQIFCIGCQDVFGPEDRLSTEKQNSLNQQYHEKFMMIRDKVMKDVPLTVEELALLNSINNTKIVDNLLDQIKIQDKIIDQLKDRQQ